MDVRPDARPGRSLTLRRWASGVLLAALAAGAAHADIYAFTDAQGVTHFSNVPADSRYQLVLSDPSAPAPSAASRPAVDWLARSARYDRVIDRAARRATLQPALVRAVIVVESGFNPRAVSAKGAVGLMQLRPSTARRYGVKNVFDPDENIRAGAKYLGDLMVRFDSNLELALAAYNAGENAVERYGRQVPPYRETLKYVPDVIRVYHRLLHEESRAGGV